MSDDLWKRRKEEARKAGELFWRALTGEAKEVGQTVVREAALEHGSDELQTWLEQERGEEP